MSTSGKALLYSPSRLSGSTPTRCTRIPGASLSARVVLSGPIARGKWNCMTPITNWVRDTRMSAKSNKSKSQGANAAPHAAADGTQTTASGASNQGGSDQGQEESPQLMKKGIYLSALVYIEGMQAPADDFAALA